MLDLLPAERAAALVGGPVTIDLDTTDVEVYSRKKRGVAYNHQGQRVGRPHVAAWEICQFPSLFRQSVAKTQELMTSHEKLSRRSLEPVLCRRDFIYAGAHSRKVSGRSADQSIRRELRQLATDHRMLLRRSQNLIRPSWGSASRMPRPAYPGLRPGSTRPSPCELPARTTTGRPQASSSCVTVERTTRNVQGRTFSRALA
jgi:hypothetical protein